MMVEYRYVNGIGRYTQSLPAKEKEVVKDTAKKNKAVKLKKK